MRRKTFPSDEQVAETRHSIFHKKVQKDIRWDKLDNTAHLFPVIAGERMSNTYRISVTLTELVDPELLQQALDIVLPRFDGFNLRLRHGVFWYYFEENGKPAPRVEEEKKFPCRYIRPNKNNSYLFRVSYYKYRINLEVFHVLTDGMGGFNFIRELTYQYLRLRHPELIALTGDSLSSGTTLNREDSFMKNYKRTSPKRYKTQKAYLIKGEHFHNGEFGVMHGYIKLHELKAVCKQYGVSINEYLVSSYIWSIYTEYLHGMPSKQPIRVAVPVNLRPYFNSNTTKNFFAMISAEFHPVNDSYTFEELLKIVQESLRSQLNSEHLEQIFSYNVSNQKRWYLKIVPLPLKNLAMRHVYTQSALANTTTITNVGVIEIAEPYKQYIEQFHAFLAISKGQHIKGTVCTYNGTLVFSFSYDLVDPSVQRGFFRRLAQDGLHIEIESNGVHYG
ncbi:MAG: hypothetical protein IJ374_03735 [Lachnospiraceae bacterium]|nr:hypothetical protein [Lachnospiraceae bacterium]